MITRVAVVAGDGDAIRVLASEQSSVRTHSGALLQLIDAALHAAAQTSSQSSSGPSSQPVEPSSQSSSGLLAAMDGLAIGAGPGSFTGLRIGMATAKGLAFAAAKPLWAISSLAALALDVDRLATLDARTMVVPLLDARRQEIFAGFYRVHDGTAESLDDERVMDPNDLRVAIAEVAERGSCERILVVGEGLRAYGHILDHALHGVAERVEGAAETPSAVAVARLAMRTSPPDIAATGAPVYIRPSEAEIKFPHGNPGGSFSSSV